MDSSSNIAEQGSACNGADQNENVPVVYQNNDAQSGSARVLRSFHVADQPITDTMEQYNVGAEQPIANTDTQWLFSQTVSNTVYSSESAQDSNSGSVPYDINFACMGEHFPSHFPSGHNT